MFERWSVKITDILEKQGIIQSNSREVYEYGLRQLFMSLLNIVTMLLIGAAMGMIFQTIIFTVSYIPLRSYAGGYHASSPKRCWAVSAIMLFGNLFFLRLFPKKFYVYLTILSLIAGIFIIFLSPVDDANKQLDAKEISVYKLRTILTISIELTILIFLFVKKIWQIIIVFEAVWITMLIMLVVGKIKNDIVIKKGKK